MLGTGDCDNTHRLGQFKKSHQSRKISLRKIIQNSLTIILLIKACSLFTAFKLLRNKDLGKKHKPWDIETNCPIGDLERTAKEKLQGCEIH